MEPDNNAPPFVMSTQCTVQNGFRELTFLPLVYLPIAAKNNQKREALIKALKKHDLE
mgnify:CR=1 FL=1